MERKERLTMARVPRRKLKNKEERLKQVRIGGKRNNGTSGIEFV